MAAPAVATSNTATASSASSIVVSFPSGLAAGDEISLFVGWYDGTNSRTCSTPTDWTSQQNTVNDRTGLALFTKTATSGDVSAGSVTVNLSGVAAHIRASVLRVTGHVAADPIAGSEIDTETNPAGATPTYTTALTPETAHSLFVMAFVGSLTSGSAGATTVGSYTSNPSVTFTEYAELSAGAAGNENFTLAVAAGPYNGSTQWTSRSATFSQNLTLERHGIAILYNGTQDASGTSALHTSSPTFFAPVGRADTLGTSALHTVSPTFFDEASAAGTRGTSWVSETKESTTWTNEDI